MPIWRVRTLATALALACEGGAPRGPSHYAAKAGSAEEALTLALSDGVSARAEGALGRGVTRSVARAIDLRRELMTDAPLAERARMLSTRLAIERLRREARDQARLSSFGVPPS